MCNDNKCVHYIIDDDINDLSGTYPRYFPVLLQSCIECARKFIIERKPNLNLESKYSGTVLMVCVKSTDDIDRVNMLIDQGADVNYIDKEGKCALFYSIYYDKQQNCKMSECLIDRGADINKFKWKIPKKLKRFIKSRNNCRQKAILLLGLKKFNKSNFDNNGRDVIRYIAKIMWSYRNTFG